ncbi:gamma-glutamyltransferase [Neptuniibacter marinus]|uniref:gamma-glutamyltransferase n=1 Tax=Neptuniibacter marinus TaxID=1806670 RepID=UPI00082C8574|nr:gamma-glutamyltransferase [Neptuniibacter marinus]
MNLPHIHRIVLLFLLFSPSITYAVKEDLAPENSTGLQKNIISSEYNSLVVTANPHATKAGLHILKQGGTAADAAVAIQAMLTLVEPQSSGIGGGAFLLYWDQTTEKLVAFDGRETAPLAANPQLFYRNKKPMRWVDALVGGRSVGTPGVLKMLELTQSKYGKRPWKTLFNDAINRSKEGFKISPRLHKLIASGINPGLNRYPEAREYFYLKDGSPLPTGFLRKNPALADSLELIAQQGSSVFYQGTISTKIVSQVQNGTDNPGLLSTADLKQYKAIERAPICLPYQAYKVCGFPPPTSGGVTVLQILKLLEHTNYSALAPDSSTAKHLFTQASRLAFADRGRYLADSDFVDVPVSGLLNENYIQQRAQLINPSKDIGTLAPGRPQGVNTAWQDDQSPELPSTSHFVVVDQWGNAASMTSSIEMAFGSTLMAGGFLLNNQLTDFSFTPEKQGRLIANRVQPGKRPRSSMSPFMIFDSEGKLYAAVGSPGGSRIISYVAESLLMMLNTELPLQQAINTPHVSNRNGITELEAETAATQLVEPLSQMGHEIKIRDLNSGLHAFRRTDNGKWESGVDNRREGLALGQ